MRDTTQLTRKTTQRIKDNLFHRSFVVKKEEGAPARLEFREGTKLCLERARLITQSYKKTEGEPEVIRRAKALDKILSNITIYIDEGQRIVGNIARDRYSLSLYPEIIHRYLDRTMNDEFGHMLTDEEKAEWREISQYWEGKSIDDKVRAILPDDVKDYVDYNGVCYSNHFDAFYSSQPVSYRKLFALGLNGVIKQADDRLSSLRKGKPRVDATEYMDQVYFLEAVIIACKAAVKYAERYAELARRLARGESKAQRRKELEDIAGVCDWVPANPPRTFYEGLQAWLFIHFINRVWETKAYAEGTRFDQLMYPLYKKDAEEGRLTRQEAQELLEFLWLKLEEMGQFDVPELHGGEAGGSFFQTLNIGGVTPDGKDATNDVSFLILDASMAVRTIQPTLALRYHADINPELVSKAIDLIRTGIGFPAIFNDSAIIPFIVNRGIPLEEARDYSIVGCISWSIAGRNMRGNIGNVGTISLAKCFELALHQGIDPRNGKQLGYPTPDPSNFKSMDDLWDSYLKQVEFVAEKQARIYNISERFYQRYGQRPFASALMEGCIEQGQDCTVQTYHSWPNICAAGPTNVADSMAAIKKFVFDDRVLSMKELLEVCDSNFEGNESLRQRLLREVPKFGNDDEYVDLLAKEVHNKSQKAVQKAAVDNYGRPYNLDGALAAGYYPWGRRIGATPDGRKAKETLADGSVSPQAGKDYRGPTAVIQSVGRISPVPFPELLNQRFMPTFLEGENKKTFAAYLKTCSDLGIYHIQFNVVDTETLLDAQAHPEKYQNLVVRVAGYSAYWTDLSVGVQDEIIRRVAQKL